MTAIIKKSNISIVTISSFIAKLMKIIYASDVLLDDMNYNSPHYMEALKIRNEAVQMKFLLLEGLKSHNRNDCSR